nr:hypothetical protein [Tanacetum cinerariifolium]
AKIKHLEDRDGGDDDPSREDATIKGRRLETGKEAGIERSTEKGNDDTEEMCSPATISVPTGSDVVPTASPIFTTATMVTPYSRRKGKEKMVESETPREKKPQEQMDVQMARIHAEEELQIMIDGLDRNNETVANLEQESTKKVKTSDEVSEEDLKQMMHLVPVEEVYVEALQVIDNQLSKSYTRYHNQSGLLFPGCMMSQIPFVINKSMYGLGEFFLDPLSIINMGSCDDAPKNLQHRSPWSFKPRRLSRDAQINDRCWCSPRLEHVISDDIWQVPD